MNVQMVPIDSIHPDPKNPRLIPDEAIESVAESLDSFGWTQPIVVDADRTIRIGHTRHLAARKRGMAEVPVLLRDELDEKQLVAMALADNRTGEFSGWDMDKLAAYIADMELSADDLPGFEEDEVNTLLELEQGLYEDSAASEAGKPRTRAGADGVGAGMVQLAFAVPRARAQALRERIEKLIEDDAAH